MIWLLACAPKVVEPAPATTGAAVASIELEDEDVQGQLPPPSWRSGRAAGPAPRNSPGEAWSRVLAGPITEPVVTDGERVYAVAEGRVYCFDLAGAELWEIRVGASGGVAVTDLGPTIGTEGGKVLVLDPKDGSTVKSLVGGGPVRGQPAQIGPAVAWGTLHGGVASTGGWGHDAALSAAGGIAADGDVWFLATLEGDLVAGDGEGVRWQAKLPGPAAEGPTLDDTHVYVPVAAREGEPGGVVAFTRDGKEAWRHRTGFGPAAALARGRNVYVPDKDGRLYALDPETGRENWSVEGFGEFGIQPLVVDGRVYAGNGDGSLSQIDGFDGGVVWSVSLGAPVSGEPALVRGMLVVGLANGRLVALKEGL
ncbi:MAG: PQQ-binding-like beta-propeller repeat protein [Myxococcota bacterium]